jgi:hypothetical protein
MTPHGKLRAILQRGVIIFITKYDGIWTSGGLDHNPHDAVRKNR